MMADWNAKGIRLGYPLPSSPQDSSLEEETNVPDSAYEAIICSLGIRLAPSFGKIVMVETKTTAKQGYDILLQRATFPLEKQLPSTTPAGSGNKPWRTYDNPYVRPPANPVTAGPDGPLEYY
jgi:hypothetical protein